MSQFITRSSVNTLVFTLKEKTTLATPYYLFELTSRLSGTKYYFTKADSSNYVDTYNEFLIEETATEDLTDGKIYLPDVGEYYYKIYEQVSATNLDPTSTTSIVEEGIIRVTSTTTAISTYQSSETITVYNG